MGRRDRFAESIKEDLLMGYIVHQVKAIGEKVKR